MKLLRFVLLLSLCWQLCACGTILSLTQDDHAVYGGVKKDFSALQSGGFLAILAVIDLPLSFVFDTLLLPMTLNE